MTTEQFESSNAFEGFTTEDYTVDIGGLVKSSRFDPELNEFHFDISEIGEYHGLSLIQSFANFFDGGKTLEAMLQAYESYLEQVEKTQQTMAILAQNKMAMFKEICLNWQKIQLEMANSTIRIEKNELVITVPKDIDTDKLKVIMESLE